MNTWNSAMREALLDGAHHIHRQAPDTVYDETFTVGLADRGLSPARRASARLADVLRRETPVILDGERIALLRTVPTVPQIFTPAERSAQAAAHRIHELGSISNVTPDYPSVIASGLDPVRDLALARLDGANDEETDFLTSVIESVDAVLDLVDRYTAHAVTIGRPDLAHQLATATRTGARTFVEALQVFRVLHYALWASFNYHNTVGRFDLHFWPYLEADLAAGRLDEDAAQEVVSEFFLSFNRDSDLYPGQQQGDNGQSLVLGGVDRSGADVWNPLSEMSLRASLELGLIDPKINLRVNGSTDLAAYVAGTHLTARGLGFPQYSNDDLVIPGLMALGYSEEDARDYSIAACWEFIVPGRGMDIANIAALSFPASVDTVVRRSLAEAETFEALLAEVKVEVARQAVELAENSAGVLMEPSPFLSVLMEGCVDRRRDVSEGLVYNNYGIHGAGLSTAADALAAVRRTVFETGAIDPDTMLAALAADFEGYDDVHALVREDAPKMGNDDDLVDLLAADLLTAFVDALRPLRNDRGGVFRPGTGSAMYYVAAAAELGATPDGRRAGEYLGANLAPSIGVKVRGPLSLLRSFTKLPLQDAINGGPVTIEVHDTVFRTPGSVEKVAMLVRSFIQDGGHQLQINALNRETLLDAQVHPELHRNLIVRVWGWSGYFVELDKKYQDQIIQRVELVP